MLARVAVFLDYCSIEAASQSKGIVVDYGKLLEYLANKSVGRGLAYAVTHLMHESSGEQERLEETTKRLYDDGYIVKIVSGDSEQSIRSRLTYEVVMDLVRIACVHEPDVIVIASDQVENSRWVVEYLKRETRTLVEIASFSDVYLEGCANRIDLGVAGILKAGKT